MSGWNTTESTTTEDYLSYLLQTDFGPEPMQPVRNFSQVFLPTLYSLVFILGFLGNGLVVCVLVKHRNQINLTDICLFNLALSDLLFVFTLPFYSHYVVVGKWTFGDFLCHFISGSHQCGFFSSIFFMVVMTLDRYMVIVHVHAGSQYRTMRAVIILTMLVWMLSVFVSLPDFIFRKVTYESQGVGCDSPEDSIWQRYNLFTTNVLGLLIPLLVMLVCYSRIIPTLMNMRTAQKHRIVKMIICIVVVFFLLWVPYNVARFLRFLQKSKIIPNNQEWDYNLRLSIVVTEAFAYTHCCLNPIIYAFVGQKFTRRALQMLKKLMPCYTRDLSGSSFMRSSVVSRSPDVNATVI